MDLTRYTPPQASLWHGRSDSLANERYFQVITFHDLSKKPLNYSKDTIILLGFCCDEGVTRNLGRAGAKAGPDALRRSLAKLPLHALCQLVDIGNIVCEDKNLEASQAALGQIISHCHDLGYRTLVLGGGHEIAWGHYQGLAPHYAKLGIINFDAHFDLRPLSNDNKGSSGTPFKQIANHCVQNGFKYNYSCIGIQALANTSSLFNLARELNVEYLLHEEVQNLPIESQRNFLDKLIQQVDSIYLTVCLDVFAACFAPGVSAPQVNGLTPWQTIPLIKHILSSKKVVSIDVAELSPPFDRDNQTAQLGATLIAEILNNF